MGGYGVQKVSLGPPPFSVPTDKPITGDDAVVEEAERLGDEMFERLFDYSLELQLRYEKQERDAVGPVTRVQRVDIMFTRFVTRGKGVAGLRAELLQNLGMAQCIPFIMIF
jgi:hypothetical protein